MVYLKKYFSIFLLAIVFFPSSVIAEEMLELSSGEKIIVNESGAWLFKDEVEFKNIQVREDTRKLLIIKSNENERSELIIEITDNDLTNTNVYLRLESSLGMVDKADSLMVEHYSINNEQRQSNWKLLNDYLLQYQYNPFFFFNDIIDLSELTIKIYNDSNFYRQSEFNIEGLKKLLSNYKSHEEISKYNNELFRKNILASLATDVGGLGDKSFNDGAYQGLQLAKEELGIGVKVVESKQKNYYIPNLTGLARDGSDIVFAVGFLMETAVKEAASRMPGQYFAGIDIGASKNDPNNFQGMLYKEEQAGYLAGVVAGLMTKEHADKTDKLNDANVVGVVLGMLIPPVEKYEVGFIQGVHSVNPECKVLSVTSDSFTNQAKGKRAALAMIEQDADIIFHAAGLTGLGAIQAAKDEGVLAIGVDFDQNNFAPDTVLTSAIKKISHSVYLVVKSVAEGNFKSGTQVYGLEQDAVGISDFHDFSDIVPQEVKDAVVKAKRDILSGDVIVETTRENISW